MRYGPTLVGADRESRSISARRHVRSSIHSFSHLKPYSDADPDGISAPMTLKIAFTVEVTAFIVADPVNFLFHLFSEPFGIRDQLLWVGVSTGNCRQLFLDLAANLAQGIPVRLERSRTVHVLEKVINPLHGALYFLHPARRIAALHQSQTKVQPCEIIVPVERQSLFQGLARFRISLGLVLCPTDIGPDVFAKVHRAIKVIGIFFSDALKIRERRLGLVS